MKAKTICLLIAGVWSFGIGLRLSLELLNTRGYIMIPNHPINLFFDFLPLMFLGTSLIYFGYRDYLEEKLGTTTEEEKEVA